jgi:hypothetical protein
MITRDQHRSILRLTFISNSRRRNYDPDARCDAPRQSRLSEVHVKIGSFAEDTASLVTMSPTPRMTNEVVTTCPKRSWELW